MKKSGKNLQWITSISAGIRTELHLNTVLNMYESSHKTECSSIWDVSLSSITYRVSSKVFLSIFHLWTALLVTSNVNISITNSLLPDILFYRIQGKSWSTIVQHICYCIYIIPYIYIDWQFFFYFCTVHVVTFTLIKNQLMHLFQHCLDVKRPDSTQACTPDTHTNGGHTTTYQYRQMTKRAAEAW
jgi:hypothetical protein